MKRIAASLVLVTVLFACNKVPNPDNFDHIFGETFTKGLRIDGHDYDSLIIENCTFTNNSLELGNVDDVIIRNCTFENINSDGIRVGFIGEASNILIDGCTFKQIGSNGIDSHEKAIDCIIQNSYFENIAMSEVGAAMGQPHHGIYWKGKNVHITGNTFVNGEQPFGNAISVRSSGRVSGNHIKNAVKNGIMYYADHPGGDSLIIENNTISNSAFYSIIMGSDGNTANHNQNVIIRFNTTVETENESVYVAEDFESTTHVEIYGNIFVNASGEYLKSFYPLNDVYSNLQSQSDIGFVNMNGEDFHILPSSAANGYCSGLTQFPLYDIDGDSRSTTNLDAGSDEIN